ncbi:MAG: tetratricopeptide repeat protein [Bacteroidetes bacterium]|nr:tetratricopeptide repeat protein [Bacteroidota bacterium]
MLLKLFIIFVLSSFILFAQNNNILLNKFALAESYENSGDLEKAVKIYEELYELDQNNNFYFESLNRAYVGLKNYAASVNLIENEITKRPKEIKLYGLLGSTYYLMGNEEKAFSTWDKPFSIIEPNPITIRVIANYAIQRRAFEKAIDIYLKGKNIAGDGNIFSNDLAQLYSITMQYEKATEEYCSILSADPLQLQTIQTKILANVNKPNALKAAIPVVEKYLNDDNLSFSYLLARLYIENKEFDNAYEIYLDIDKKQSENGVELYRYAEFLFKEAQYKLSKNVYRSIIELFPKSPLITSVKLGYAKTLEAILMGDFTKQLPLWKPYFIKHPYESDDIEETIDAFNEVVRLYKNSEAAYEALLRIGMIKFYLQDNQIEAKQYLNKIIEETRMGVSITGAYSRLGEIALLNGDLAEAEKNYSQIIILANTDIQIINDAKYKLARIKLYLGKIAQAKKLLAEVMINLKDNNANDALELSLLLNTSKNDSSNLMLFANAEFLADQKKFNEAGKKYKLLANNPQVFILHSVASLRMAEMELAQDNYPHSIELLEKVFEEGEKNIYSDKALYLLGDIYQYGIGDNTKAVEMYEKLLIEFPISIYIDDARFEIIKLKDKLS